MSKAKSKGLNSSESRDAKKKKIERDIDKKKRLEARKRLEEEKKKEKEEKAKTRREEREKREKIQLEKEIAFRKKGLSERARKLSKKVGYVRFFVSGKSGALSLTPIQKICLLKDVEISKDGASFNAPAKHSREIIAILNNLCYDYKIIRYKGVLPHAVNGFARWGLVLGLILSAVIVTLYPMLVTSVVIMPAGFDEVPPQIELAAFDAMREAGVQKGKLILKLDTVALEKELLKIGGVAYAKVTRQGTHITAYLANEQKSENIIGTSGSTVKAQKFAVVTRVIVDGGTAAVRYGDIVRPGDLLIDGYTLFGDEKIATQAKGSVYGKIYRKKTVFFADKVLKSKQVLLKRTSKLSFFGKVPSLPNVDGECTTKIEVKSLNFLLPIKVYTFEVYGEERIETSNTMTDDEMFDEVYSSIVTQFEEPLVVLEKYCEKRIADGGVYVTVTVCTEELIS